MMDSNKQQEKVLKADIKNIEKMWKEISENDKLDSFLAMMTKDELIKIGRKYSIKGLTTLKKADAVEKVKEIILNGIDVLLNICEEDSLRFLQQVLKNQGKEEFKEEDFIYSNFFRNRGVLFTGIINEHPYMVIPEELQENLNSGLTKEIFETARIRSEIVKAIAGMAYYYGVISKKDILENLNKLFNIKLDNKELESFIEIGEELGYDYVSQKENICHVDVEEVENIVKLQKENADEICKFDKKTLIKASAPDFIEENKCGQNLQRVFSEMFVIDKKILKEEMDAFVIAIKNELSEDEAIDIFLEAYEIESNDEREIFAEELRKFARSIKKWSLNGFSEDELVKSKSRVVNTVKIGRNDPCICGSGKKYKKCCGK